MRTEGRGPRRAGGGRMTLVWLAAAVIAVAGVTGLLLKLTHAPASGPGFPAASPAPAAAGPARAAGAPSSPPVRVCGNKAVLGGGPASPPQGAVTIPAGDDSNTALAHNWTIRPDTTYWFAPGIHTLGLGQFNQIVPANNDTFIGAPGAVLDGQHSNLYAFTQTAHNVTIRYLTIQHFGAPGQNNGEGVVNNGAARGWRIDHLTVRSNAGAGVALGPGNVLTHSCLENNGEYGFIGAGPHLRISHDEIADNNTDNWESRRPGCGCTGGAKFWSIDGAIVTGNYIHDNRGPGLWADTNNRSFDVERNYFASNQGVAFIYETSYNLRLAHNTFIRNALVAGPNVGGFPDSAVYISESGSDRRVRGPYGNTLAITANAFTDNWGGVVLWENANRYCSSGANTSTGFCTLVDPSRATLSSCSNSRLRAAQPYYGDCRWKTQNVLVSKNYFAFDPARIGPDCTPSKYCGFNGIFSQWGSWLPYHGTVVSNHITFGQNNHFVSNTYTGPWRFVVHEQGNSVDWATWRGSPYHQDAGSVMNRG